LKKPTLYTLALAAALAGAALPGFAADADEVLKTQLDKVSYTLGMNIGKQLQQNEVIINLDIYMQGLKDALKGEGLLLTDDQAREVMMQFQKELREKQMAKSQADAEKNKRDGEAFLAANKDKEGVKTLPSGLQYKVLLQGEGPIPKETDTVATHYRGSLIDGTEFDSSYKRGEPATFPVNGVIKGWTEALLQMPVGSKWQLFIPSDIAYGEKGRPQIPPNSTLLFDIELIEIKKPEAGGAKN